MIAQMVKIGEETGELEKMLSKVADFYEDEVDASIQALTSIIEPMMMVGVGIMVGIIIISMYLPMFKLLHARQVARRARTVLTLVLTKSPRKSPGNQGFFISHPELGKSLSQAHAQRGVLFSLSAGPERRFRSRA